MRYRVIKCLYVSIKYIPIPFLLILLNPLDSIMTAPSRSESETIIREVFLKYRFYDLPERLLYYPVFDNRNAKRSFASPAFGYIDP